MKSSPVSHCEQGERVCVCQPGVSSRCLGALFEADLSCMATEAFWVPGSHSHWSHIRLIKSDSRPASWLTQFALIRFPFHAERTLTCTHTHSRAHRAFAETCAHKTENQQRAGQHPLSSNEKQKKPLPWQLPAYSTSSGGPRFPVWLRSYCFGSLSESRSIPRQIISPLAGIYAKSSQPFVRIGNHHAEKFQMSLPLSLKTQL